ncbi:conjugative transfer protein MobI(A/C), partial [Thiolapillus sp.]|uniref:conjugative transfer protein MobI(A/C) n=3 Tax=Thiolapillus sp. TaxID=2017437 RepID=UPI003AF49641
KRMFRKVSKSGDEVAKEAVDTVSQFIEAIYRGCQERGMRCVERHWFFRSAGNYVQQKRPKGERTYSYLSPRYEDHGNHMYYRWTRFVFRSRKGGQRRQRVVPIPQTKEFGYDLRRLKRGSLEWERGAITSTEKMLTKVREVNKRIVEARNALEKLANAMADLDKMDHEHYATIMEEIAALGYTRDEVEKLELAHLKLMKRAQKEGSDMRPLSETPFNDVDVLLKLNPTGRCSQEELPETVTPGEEDWVPRDDSVVLEDIEEAEDDVMTEPWSGSVEPDEPDPDILDRLHEPWKYSNED